MTHRIKHTFPAFLSGTILKYSTPSHCIQNNMKKISILLSILLGSVLFSSGCTSTSVVGEAKQEIDISIIGMRGDPRKQKSIFVFLDGTSNTRKSDTNIGRLYKIVSENSDPQMTAIYIPGVGSNKGASITESALGRGMQARILKGYTFISKNYNLGDNIYIFGFSRGAHQARSLAGLIAYAGTLSVNGHSDDELADEASEIIELVKKNSDIDHLNKWQSWLPGKPGLLATEIRENFDISTHPAEVNFLGVWDTVPGSSLKSYGVCKENKGIIKNHFSWIIPGIDKGERYKTDSYPPIRTIAHAVSIDEKRSKFKPILLCKPINPTFTEASEVWFPGAHSDVGGGYDDSNGLPELSLAWMIDKFSNSYKLQVTPAISGKADGLSHWSIGDKPGNTGSDCIDRKPPVDAIFDISYVKRQETSPVPVRCDKITRHLEYPIACAIGNDCPRI